MPAYACILCLSRKPIGFFSNSKNSHNFWIFNKIPLQSLHRIAEMLHQREKKIQQLGALFGVLTVLLMKVQDFWGVIPCRLVNIYQRFAGTYYLCLQLSSSTVTFEIPLF